MSVGMGLLNKALVDKVPIGFLDGLGVGREEFAGEEVRILEFMQEYSDHYKQLPSVTTVEAELEIQLSTFPDEPMEYWAEGVKRRTVSNIVLSAIPGIAKSATNGDANLASDLLKDLYIAIQAARPGKNIVTLDEVAHEVLEEHDGRQMQTISPGVPFGFPYLDDRSGGAQGGDFIPIAGRPSTGKTFVMQRMSIAAYDAGMVPMLVTTEMQPIQYTRRILALRTGLSQNKIRFGMLSTHIGRKLLVDEIEDIGKHANKYYLLRGSTNTTMKDVVLHLKEKRPDVAYVDGAYMLETDNPRATQFEQVTVGAKRLKLLAQEMNIPIICTYQFRKKSGGGLEDIYQTDVIAQLGSIVLGLKDEVIEGAERVEWGLRTYKIIEVLKGREGEKGEFRIVYDMADTQIEEVNPQPILNDDLTDDAYSEDEYE